MTYFINPSVRKKILKLETDIENLSVSGGAGSVNYAQTQNAHAFAAGYGPEAVFPMGSISANISMEIAGMDIKPAIETLQTQVANAGTSISTLTDMVQANESSITTLQSQITNAGISISSLSDMISTNENSIIDLQDQVSAISPPNSNSHLSIGSLNVGVTGGFLTTEGLVQIGNTLRVANVDILDSITTLTANLATLSSNLATLSSNFTLSQVKYAFSVTSDINATITVLPGAIFPFNFIVPNQCFVIPSTSAYNTSTYKYTIPKSGFWKINYQLFFNSAATLQTRVAIYRNNVLIMRMGAATGFTESGSCFYILEQGDVIDVRNDDVTNLLMYFGVNRCLFYGELVA
jgi:hypothetical protein